MKSLVLCQSKDAINKIVTKMKNQDHQVKEQLNGVLIFIFFKSFIIEIFDI